MEAKKVNIFAFLMMIAMCAVSIFVCVGKKDNNSNVSDDILALYKKIDEVDTKVDSSAGKSAYELAVEDGFPGNEHEWLLSLKGDDGQDADLTPVSIDNIYNAYLGVTGQTSEEYSKDKFLLYYYSVAGKLDKKSATQLAYSTTVDICYSYTSPTYFVQVNGTQIRVNDSLSGEKGGVAAGAGIIYSMFDSNTTDSYKYDTAYIITNYHVAYIENYSNDPNYVVYANYSVGFNSATFDYDYTVNEYFLAEDYKTVDKITKLSVDEAIDKHFLIGGDTGDYYGIYLYGYQDENYKLKATFVGGSADNDIAVLKIERKNQSSQALADVFFESGNYEPATIGDSAELVGGEDVIAVGNPLIANTTSGMTLEQYEQAYIDAMLLSATDGIVSSVSDEIVMESLINSGEAVTMRLIRVSAAINSGNSGGGLYDLYGNLIGIVNSKIASSSYDNVGYAIPINVAAGIADQIIYQCDGSAKSSTNTRIKTLTTENLGFTIKNGVSNSSASTDANGHKVWNVSYNVLVESVQDESIAKTNGLQVGDIITKVSFAEAEYVAGIGFDLNYELKDLLLHVKLNCSQITFTISRDGSEQEITFNLTEDGCFKEIC